MKNYTLFTAEVPFTTTKQSAPIAVAVPSNAIPLQLEYRPAGIAFHFLVPCDEAGNPIEEVITPNVYEVAWNKLYELFTERSEQDNLDAMDSVLKGVMSEMQDEVNIQTEEKPT